MTDRILLATLLAFGLGAGAVLVMRANEWLKR